MSTANTISAADLTFGVEIECFIPVAVTIPVGHYHAGIQVPELPAGWNAQRDSSLHTSRPGMRAVEIVSPILKGADGVKQILAVLAWLNGVGAHVNPSCGFHVHVGVPANDSRRLGRVVAVAFRHERGIYAVTGTKSRERGSFCKPLSASTVYKAVFKDKTLPIHRASDRYTLLNLTNVIFGGRPTVEFRAFSATTNPTKVLGYVGLALGMVVKALVSNRDMSWDRKPVASRKGEGRKALATIFADLLWTRRGQEMGWMPVEGGPEIQDVKAEMARLADKYDAEA